MKKDGEKMRLHKWASWIFIIQAIYLLVIWSINLIIPLAVAREVSIVWILFGIGILFIAKGIRDGKKWAPMAVLFGTTLPYIIISAGINIIQRNYRMIYGGPRNPGIFALPLLYWFLFILNFVLSLLLIYRRKNSLN